MGASRTGTHGVSTNGVAANLSFFDRGTFCGCAREPTFIFQKVPGRSFIPNLSEFITFAGAPLVLTPFVRKQVDYGGYALRGILSFPEARFLVLSSAF